MKFKIHRGANEIGGSCVEIWTESSRVVLDLGMPLVNPDQTPFESKLIKDIDQNELLKMGVLPEIDSLYSKSHNTALVISHAHQDHYGLVKYIDDSCVVFLGEPTHKLIQLTNTFTRQQNEISNYRYYKSGQPFFFGDIEITPYLMDHAAFDAHAFMVKADGKSLFYSGDFRIHGRKPKVFNWFKYNVDSNVDYLLLEGTTLGRNEPFPTEEDLENAFVDQFKRKDGVNLVYVSGQNIDRLTTIYRACKRSGKIFAIDFYVACVLKEMARFNNIPHPSNQFPEVKVFFPYRLSRMISNQGEQQLLYQFKSFKITKEEIDNNFKKVVMTVRPSMMTDLKFLNCLQGGAFIYSMWGGYRKEETTKQFIDFLTSKGMEDVQIHTSGHADLGGLKKMVDALKPKFLVPIHTFEGDEYKKIFDDTEVKRLADGEVVVIQ